jgi:hypothetical protein
LPLAAAVHHCILFMYRRMLVELIALAIVLEKGSADEICYSLMTAVSQVDNLVFALTISILLLRRQVLICTSVVPTHLSPP